MKKLETNKPNAPSTKERRRKTRFSDNHQWTMPVESRSTSTSGTERGDHEIQTVDHDPQQHHPSTSKGPSSRPCPSSSSAAGGSGTCGSPKKYTATKISGLRYKFHSDKNGKIVEKQSDDEEDATKFRKKIESCAATDSSSSLSPPNKRKNDEPDSFEEKKRQAVAKREIVEQDEVAEIQDSSKDCDLVNPPAIQTRQVDEPPVGDDDDEEDLDILIIDLSDKERAEMESWAK